ncbi:MAG: CDP-alcohol phosphatidyltransferase family protein [Lachnospiraceae bacterium]|nr:CDP-alcohol phosphatidyltransferase family protein [Lachnospiraceae bacterium]
MKGQPRKEDLINIPNVLCYIRILLVPVFVYLFIKQHYWQSALVVVIASATDVVDGWIARHFNMITDWGKFIDPLADKLMQLAMLIMSIFKNPLVAILISLFVVKEIIMLIVGLYIYHKGDNLNGAMWCGKLCTVVLDLSLLLIIGLPMSMLSDMFVLILIVICSAFLILSFVVYMNAYRKLYREMKSDGLINATDA